MLPWKVMSGLEAVRNQRYKLSVHWSYKITWTDLPLQAGAPVLGPGCTRGNTAQDCLKEFQIEGRRLTGNIILILCGSWYCQSIFRRPEKTWKHTVLLPDTSFSTSSPKQLLLSVSFQTRLHLVKEGSLNSTSYTLWKHHMFPTS